MTPQQFDLIAKLLRSQKRIAQPARRVLVDGLSPSDAANEAGISPQSMSNALSRFRAAHAEIASAYKTVKSAL